ncbi:MAG: sensor histidine kinase, partial [Candidatus Binatia bacterium]
FNQMTRDLKRIHWELEQRRRYTETLLANITAGVISLDPAGKITTINKAAVQILGLDGGEAQGKSFGEVFRLEHLKPVREVMEEVKGSQSVEREVKLTLADRTRTLMITAAALADDDGRMIGLMIFLEDITQIQNVQRMEVWREVAQRIAHEIKNPLTPIQLSAERLRKRYARFMEVDGSILDKCTSTIIKQVEDLKKLVNEFANYARLPAAKLAPSDLNQIVTEALFLFKEGHRGINFRCAPEPGLPRLELDREQMKRALINLLDNAVAAVGDKGEVTITTLYDPVSKVVQLEIADDGCGIAPEMRERIFEPYFSTKRDGTGLGLSIVSTVIADHHGNLRVRPNEPRGTKFTIELPAWSADLNEGPGKREAVGI